MGIVVIDRTIYTIFMCAKTMGDNAATPSSTTRLSAIVAVQYSKSGKQTKLQIAINGKLEKWLV